MTVETRTTIKGGLPVIARGRYVPGYRGSFDPPEPPEPATVEDIEIFWLSGKACRLDLSLADEEAVIEDLLQEVRDSQ